MSSRQSEATSLVDESFRNILNDVTFSLPQKEIFTSNKHRNFGLQKENKEDYGHSILSSMENMKGLGQNTAEILFLKRKLAEKNDEIAKYLKNCEEFSRISKENEERILSLEICERTLQQKLEIKENELKSLQETNEKVLL